ncbi:MAG: hypothetical protein GVY19_04750 [Bacteroidetes bacterium]|jgi:Leucine-rich repeat (LRR) protein|nr:hypothetical protein [Bacteroidota bacterium]
MKHLFISIAIIIIASCGHQKPAFDEAYLFSIDTLYAKKTYRDLEKAYKADVKEVNKIVIFNKELDQFPKELYDFPYLNIIEITFNNLSELPADLDYFQYTQSLYLQKNAFEKFPAEVYQLKHLKRLGIGKNQLSEIPVSIDSLQAIEELYLERNQISTLPKSFYNLKNLRILKLSHNQLSSLSSELTKLTNLEKLFLTNNKFTSIPEQIEALPNLRYLEIERNPIPRDTLKIFAQKHPGIKVVY